MLASKKEEKNILQPVPQQAMAPHIIQKVEDTGVMAVLVIDDLRHAVPVAKALLEGGVSIVELTLRTKVALKSAALIKKEVPQITLGFGTVIIPEQVKAVVDSGADFAVAPGCNAKVLAEAAKQGLSFAPGVMTPSDIELSLEYGCRLLKYFPAETSGGMKHLVSMVNPYEYLGLKFIPLGGCNNANAPEYLQSPLIAAIGGSWIANRKLIQTESWQAISANAREICETIKRVRHQKSNQ